MAQSTTAQEALWLKRLSEEFGQSARATTLNVDNYSAQNVAQNEAYQAKTEHIDVRHHFFKEKIIEKILEVKYVPDKQIEHALRKAVNREKKTLCGVTGT